LAVYSFTRAWWIADFGRGEYIKIFGWGLEHNLLALENYVAEDVTPQWQIRLAWIYIAVSGGLAFLSTYFKKIVQVLVFSIVGVGFIVYPAVAIYKVIAERTAVFGIALEGRSWVGGNIYIDSCLTHWHYLMYIGGGILVALAITEIVALLKKQNL
jgi:Mn2+/Fe2+ NRAMP family transporter